MDDLLRDAKDMLLEASSPYIPSCAEDEQWCKYRDELCERIQQRLDTGGWIPVAERSPEDGKLKEVTDGTSRDHGVYRRGEWMLNYFVESDDFVPVWWRDATPLPALPKEPK